jgi:hypothetical protein
LIEEDPVTQRRVEASARFEGPWWVAVALLDIEPDEVVGPVLEELRVWVTNTTGAHRTVAVERGVLERGAGTATIALHWSGHTVPRALPEMDARLQVVEVDPNETEVRFVGAYTPPFDAVNELRDAIAAHRRAQRTANDLVERLAERIEAAVSEHIGTKP